MSYLVALVSLIFVTYAAIPLFVSTAQITNKFLRPLFLFAAPVALGAGAAYVHGRFGVGLFLTYLYVVLLLNLWWYTRKAITDGHYKDKRRMKQYGMIVTFAYVGSLLIFSTLWSL
ncbi:MAG: hypothetical protein WD603_01505 [Patescibacteria group bacterium]